MSLIGKGSSSLRKKDVLEQKSIALGFKKTVFAHRADAGEAGINLTALVTPPEMSTNGFTNPSVADLSKANIFQYRNNLKIVSSLSGLLIPYMSYTVNSSTYIAFKDFTAQQDEVFLGYIDDQPVTTNTVVDGQAIVASGILAAGQTDFNIGSPITINKNPTAQVGDVMVFVDRALQYRRVGNQTSGDGDYIEVPVAGGLGSLIRFDASGTDRFITVVSNGTLAERPDGSMMALIERVQGQVDQMVPTLAAVAGVPETTFQTGPNSVDLKQFGDLVLDQQAQLDDHEARIDDLENPLASLTTNGYQKMPNGMIMQWGRVINASNNQTFTPVTFPIPFTTIPFSIQATLAKTGFVSGTHAAVVNSANITTTGFEVGVDYDSDGSGTSDIYWFAIGK